MKIEMDSKSGFYLIVWIMVLSTLIYIVGEMRGCAQYTADQNVKIGKRTDI